ncbi:MAG TPA: hypothetical protein VMB25_19075 [Bryobacteraceae bacterium]|nr:hypothetical protein [Bryobacteraceae bacterium]
MKAKTLGSAILCTTALLASLAGGLMAQAPTAESQPSQSDVAALKAQLAEQQKQIDQLKATLDEERKLIERTVSASTPAPATPARATLAPGTPAADNQAQQEFALPRNKALGDVASASPILPPAPAPVAPVVPYSAIQAAPPGAPSNPCEAGPDQNAVPPYIRIGSVCAVPIGFMDATFVWRDKNAASGIGSNFGSVPYNNTVAGKTSEDRFSIQNSRLGFRIDGDWKGVHFIGYNEFDFLGTSGASNITVTNGAVVPRIRLYWVDARKNGWEFLAGQSWSMLTPNRRGISPFPGDIFYSQVMDVNYMVGLTWTRQPGFRVLYHFGDKATWGFSAENPDQYIGGYGGEGAITLPAALTSLAGTQLDQANLVFAAPQLTPDFISKFAIDPSSRFHAEVAGILSTFKILNNPGNLTNAQYSTKSGGGVLFSMNGEVFKGFRLITTNFWGDGEGRYMFGQAPDLVVGANGNISLMHSGGTVDGFEARTGKFLWFGYYGGVYIPKNVQIDANGKPVGYGYVGSSNSQNKATQEITFGYNETVWSSPRYGSINMIAQYEYATRNPWYIAAGAPDQAHDNTIYFDLRYTLPGSMPNF